MSTKQAIALISHAKRFSGLIIQNIQIQNYLSVSSAPRTYLWRSYTTEKVQTNQSEPPSTEGTAADGTEIEKKFLQEIETLKNDLKLLKAQNENIMDKYKRSLADSENLRVRLTKQISDAKIFGIQNFCKDLLEVADTLGHATHSVPKEALNDNAHLKSLYEGLTMTQASLLQVFKRHGLEQINPLNEKFDPNMHEALFQREDKSVGSNIVVEVTKLGYKLHERCIRPALVGVSKSS